MRISLVIETWNVGTDAAAVEDAVTRLVARLGAEALRADELVVTHAGLPGAACARLRARAAPTPLTLVRVPDGADYYVHKNLGFAASTGDVVAFVDGDCTPCPGWLASLTAPIVAGEAEVCAGPTGYPPGPASVAGTAIDFPLLPSGLADGAVRNFFANNVAFARPVFEARRYPTIDGMFHGQCQILGLALHDEGIAVRLAPGARLEHAWPEGARALLAMRLLRGADARAMTPHLVRSYAPRLEPVLETLGPWPALALLAARTVRGGRVLLRDEARPAGRAAGALFLVGAFLVDASGALAQRRVYQRLM